jgi:hypothetical protein
MKLLKQIIPLAILMGLLGSCKKDLLDINTSPNDPTSASATPGVVLPAALSTTANIYNNPSADSRFAFAGIWMGHIGYSGNYAISTENLSYAITSNFGSGAFGSLYDNIEDYDFVEKKGAEQGNNFYRGIGMFMKAYNFQTLVDLYNNIPYFTALQGTSNSKPSYDDAKAIYDDLAKKMDTAISIFKTATSGSITGDIMFAGDPNKWLRFANTVKLRLLLRQSERADRAAYIQSQLPTIAAGPFLVTDAAINPGYLNSAGKSNPFWSANINVSGTYTNDFYRAGQYSVAFFQSHNDPRVGRFFKPATSSGLYQGNYFGDQGLTNSKTSEYGTGILKSFSQSSILMLAAESYFIQAEAALRGWITGDPKALYQKGVEASFTYLGLTVADAQTYYNQAGDKQVNFAAATTTQEKLAVIIRQKWAALTLINELEPYNDYRRLKLPADVPLSASSLSTGKMPTRLLYPQREYEVNSTNAPASTPTDKIWWMP